MYENKLNFEEQINRLKDIVSKMQSGNLSLDESLNLYEEGQKIICNLKKELKEANNKVENIVSINKN